MILINKTYSECTPESAENGELSDSGFIWEDAECTFRELVGYFREHTECSDYPAHSGAWFSSGFSVDDYGTGLESETAIHFSRSNPAYKAKYWALAAKCAGVIK
jgi:hypothetical protein